MDEVRVTDYQIMAVIPETEVWRQLVIPANISFVGLHRALRSAVGWSAKRNDHNLYSFENEGSNTIFASKFVEGLYDDYGGLFEGMVVESADKKIDIELSDDVLTYTYYDDDMDRSWVHQIILQKRGIARVGLTHPILLNGAGQCPPEGTSQLSYDLNRVETQPLSQAEFKRLKLLNLSTSRIRIKSHCADNSRHLRLLAD